MTILRSRSVAGQAVGLVAGGDAIAETRRRLAAEREAGRQDGLKEAEARIAAAEGRGAKAQAAAEEQLARRTAELESRLGAAVGALERVATHAETLEKQIVQGAEAEIVRLALAVAAHVLKHEVETDQEWMDELVGGALMQVPDRRGVALRMHPDDGAVARDRQRILAAGVPGLERLVVQDDAHLERGSCVLMSQGTRLDAGVAGSWERVAGALIAAAPHPPLAVHDDGTVPASAPVDTPP